MRRAAVRVWLLACLLAGCAAAPPALEPAEEPPPTPAPPQTARWFEAISHITGHGALELSFRVENPTTCTLGYAANRESIGGRWRIVHFHVFRNDEHYIGSFPYARTLPTTEVRAAGLDTGNPWEQVFDAFNLGRNGTYGGSYQNRGFQAGETIRMLIQVNDGLKDGGLGLARGGSLRLAAGCDRPVTLLGAREDPTAYWFNDQQVHHEQVVATDAVTLAQGSLRVTTTGHQTSVAFYAYHTKGRFTLGGVIVDELEFNQTKLWDERMDARTGPAGDIEVAWDTVNFGLGGWSIGIWGWRDGPPIQPAKPGAWSWYP
jgi:hypothetical protein